MPGLYQLGARYHVKIGGAGEVAERLKAAVLKTARLRKGPRGFESHPLRRGVAMVCNRNL